MLTICEGPMCGFLTIRKAHQKRECLNETQNEFSGYNLLLESDVFASWERGVNELQWVSRKSVSRIDRAYLTPASWNVWGTHPRIKGREERCNGDKRE